MADGGSGLALTKISLRKMVGRTRLSLVQLQTVITQIEAILNDRPLMRVSTDIQSFEPLTPAHLPSLREHHQATKGPIEEAIKIGDIVQVHQDSKRSEWKLAVVEQLNRGADGMVRSAEIRTTNGKTSRLLNKLYPVKVFESNQKVIQAESKKPNATEAVTEIPSVSTIQDPPQFVSSIQIPVVDEVSTRSGRIQRGASRQAAENIKRMARMEMVEEEEEE